METTRPAAAEGQLFVFDIGTRSVVGIAGHKDGDLFVVDAWDMEPHARRAMIDGQIEDIEQVARVAGTVKERIEEKLGVSFASVSVAAAGRALKTIRTRARARLPAGVPISLQAAYGIENIAINKARAELDEAHTDVPYYCVGHSVVRWLLDGYPFTTVIDHTGNEVEVEVIATFLPAEVVESLHRCMDLLNLAVDTITLEPIAAMRAVIPQDLRLLNLALVDIGAGTSDIALSADSTVSGYTMATVAGDEVTETIIKEYLVDFNTAERLKMALVDGGSLAFTDILGFEKEPKREELLETIEPAVEALATVIAEKILECNEEVPAAVFLVGGGSKTPGLVARVAEKLGLPHDKAAVAGTQFSGRVLNEDAGLDGPEYATPVGIALVAADNAELEGATVTINDEKVRLFTGGSTSVMDALLIGGYRYSDLMGRNGRSLTFTLNGGRCVVRGGPYTAAVLHVNGKAASLSTPVQTGDAIAIEPAQSGEDAEVMVADYADGQRPIRVSLNDRTLLAGLIARVNGAVATPDTPILEGDDVQVFIMRTVGDLCDAARVATKDAMLTVNGKAATPDTPLRDADVIVCQPREAGKEAPAEENAPGISEEKAVASAATTVPRETAPEAVPAGDSEKTTASAPAQEAPATMAKAAAETPSPLQPTAGHEEKKPVPEVAQPKAPAEITTAAAAGAPPESAPTGVAAETDSTVKEGDIPEAAAESASGTPPASVFGAQLRKAVRKPRPVRNLFGTPTQKPDLSTVLPPEQQAPPAPAAEPAPSAPAAPLFTPEEDTPGKAKPLEPTGTAENTEPLTRPTGKAEDAPAPTPDTDTKAVAQPKEPSPVLGLSEENVQPSSDAPDTPEKETPPPAVPGRSLRIVLNGKTVVLPPKADGEPHRLFDMLTLVDIDPQNPKGLIKVLVNGQEAPYLEELVNGDKVEIGWQE